MKKSFAKLLTRLVVAFAPLMAFATEVGDNILKNGSFEEGTSLTGGYAVLSGSNTTGYWTGGSSTYLLSKTGDNVFLNNNSRSGCDGNYAIALNQDAYIEQTITVETEGYYQLSFDYVRRNSNVQQHDYILLSANGVDLGVKYLPFCDATQFQAATLPPVKLLPGTYPFRISSVRHHNANDLALVIDNLKLTLYGTGYVGAEALVNGGFEEETTGVSGHAAFGTASTRGWTGDTSCYLANKNTAFGSNFYAANVANNVLNWDYAAVLNRSATLTGTVNAPIAGRYRLSFVWHCRYGNKSSSHMLGIVLRNGSDADIVVRESSAISGNTRTVTVYEDIELKAGEYQLIFTTSLPSNIDDAFCLDEVSLICTEKAIDPDLIVTPPEIVLADVIYDGNDHKPEIAEGAHYSITYDPAGTWIDVGTYSVRLALDDGYMWADHSSADIVSNMTIRARQVEKPVIVSDFLISIGGEDVRPQFADSADYQVSYTPDAPWTTEGTDYHAVFMLADAGNLEWADGTTAPLDYAFEVSTKELEQVEKPVQSWTNHVVTVGGGDLKPGFAANDGYEVVYEPAGEWTAVGMDTVTFKLNAGYVWSDGSRQDVVFTYELFEQLQNEWVTEPAISKTSWPRGETPGAITAQALYGEVTITYSGGLTEMPTAVGSYEAEVRVAETERYTGLAATIRFSIEVSPWDALRPEHYTGPKIAIIGDSYSAFPGSCDESHDSELGSSTTREYWYPRAANGIDNVTQMWWYQTIRDLDGYFACNDAWSGTALCEYSWGCVYGNPQSTVAVCQMCNRLEKTLPTDVDPDVVLLLAGTNDAWIRYDQNNGSKDGASVIDAFIGESWYDLVAKPKNHGAVMTTMKPGFAQTVWWIREKFPHAKIMFIANKDEKISDNFSAALEEMAKVTHCKFLQLDVAEIEKLDGHPTAAGMTNLSQQVTAAYRAWANDGFAIDGLEAMGEEVEGVPTASGDAQIGRLNTDYGYLRVVENSSRHYAVMVVTNTAATYEIELPAGKTNEYLVVGGGGSGGNVYNGTLAGAGGGAAVREGFHRWSGTDPVTLSVTVGVPGTTTGGGTGGKGGTTKIELSGGTPFIYADGGGAGGNWGGNGGDSEGSGGGGGSGDNGRTLGGQHIGSSRLLGSSGGNGNNDDASTRSAIPGAGGGAGGPGGHSTQTIEGAGGPGVVRHITGSPVEYAAGGLGTRTKTISAAVSTGSGGSSYFGAGGSGIAAFRYELTDEEYAEIMQKVPRVIAKPTLPQSAATYDGSDFKPGFSDSDAYTVAYSADEWINGGTYAVTFRLREGGQWEGDGSTADVVLNFVIRQAENEWTTAPSISKSSWLEKVDEPGVITAAAKYGEVQILYPGLATEMPTIPGDYEATVAVAESPNWTALEVKIPFTIEMNVSARTPVAIPEVPPAGTIAYDEQNHRPSLAGTDLYSVILTAGEWIEPGNYFLTLALKDPDNYKWSDETVQNRVYAYTIKKGPTQTTGTRIAGSTVAEEWGERYLLQDDVTRRGYWIVKVTNVASEVTWTVPAGVSVEYLVVGGGGSGGGGASNVIRGGGGGAGGLVTGFFKTETETVFAMTVGRGGDVQTDSVNGGNSTLSANGETMVTALGGGAGGDSNSSGTDGAAGGSGGGAGIFKTGGAALQPEAGGYGHSGGSDVTGLSSGWTNAAGGSGGGGAGGPGGNATTKAVGGNGGDGLQLFITGEGKWYAGGGGGAGTSGGGVGGSGVGGSFVNGAKAPYLEFRGVDGTGSGGAGSGSTIVDGVSIGRGGSGVIILRCEQSVPTLESAAVSIPDPVTGVVEASALVVWGGAEDTPCQLVLKYGKVSGAYTDERVLSAAGIGTISGTTALTRGTWYAVLVARSSEGESAVSQEFELYSTKPRKSTVFYLK